MSPESRIQAWPENDYYSTPPTIQSHVTVVQNAKPKNTLPVEEVKELEEEEEEEDSANR